MTDKYEKMTMEKDGCELITPEWEAERARKKDYLKKIEDLTRVAHELMPKLPYHNFNHAIDVYSSSSALARLEKVGEEGEFLLKSAALLHDIVYIPGRNDNEEMSAEFARQYLPNIGYSGQQTYKVMEMILATKWPQKPRNLLEQVICDADLANLGREDFLEQWHRLVVEDKVDELKVHDWYENRLDCIKKHNYHTYSARMIGEEGKLKNIQELERILTKK